MIWWRFFLFRYRDFRKRGCFFGDGSFFVWCLVVIDPDDGDFVWDGSLFYSLHK